MSSSFAFSLPVGFISQFSHVYYPPRGERLAVGVLLRVELHKVERILILHPMMAVREIDDDMPGAKLCGVLWPHRVQVFALLRLKRRTRCVQILERCNHRLGGEHILKWVAELPRECLEIDGLVQVPNTYPTQNRLSWGKTLSQKPHKSVGQPDLTD